MTREDYVKSLIKSNGYNLKEFATKIQMPYTTLLSILNGSLGGAAMDNVLKICRALDLTVEELNCVVDQTAAASATEKDGIDPQLFEIIRSLSREKQHALLQLLAGK